MKPIKLEIEGLHSFEDNQVIDFRLLSTHGIFGIFGVTGSGKSTILDAIILALYGKVQRSKTNSDFINLKRSKAVVTFDFIFSDEGKEKVYSVKRVFKRKKKNPQEVDQIAEVFEIGAFGSRQIMEGATKVDAFITNLLGMSDVEFLKCIALPQGEFAAFLKAKPNERVSIIGNIFDLNKYGQQLWEKVRARTENIEREKAVVEGKITVLGEVSGSELENSKNELKQLVKEVEEKKIKFEEISKIERAERDVATLNKELDDVNKEIKELDNIAETIQVKKETFNKAKKLHENSFIFSRTEELGKLIVSEEDEFFRLSESLKAERARSDEFYCDSTLELESIKEKAEKSVAKIERLKNLRTVDEKLKLDQSKLETVKQDLQIIANKADSAVKKLGNIRVEKNLKNQEIKELDGELDILKEQLKGFECVLAYNSLSEFTKELGCYKSYIEEKHTEAVQAMSAAIENHTSLSLNKKSIEDEILELYKQFDIKGSVDSAKMIFVVQDAYQEISKFMQLKGKVESLISQRVEVAAEICGEKNKLERFTLEKIRLDDKLNEVSDEIVKIKNKIHSVYEAKGISLSENGVADVISRIRIGDTCPICCSEVLQKSNQSSIDVMVLDEEILELGELLKRKEEAKDNLIYSVSKTVTKIEAGEETLSLLEEEQEKLKNKIVKLFGLGYDATIIDEEEELKRIETVLQQKLDASIKAEKDERQLLARLQEVGEDLIKQNCVSVASRLEMNHWAELLENVSSSVKAKDMQLLSLVSQGDDVSKKLSELEKLNAKLDVKLKERDALLDAYSSLETDIVRLEAELASVNKEKSDLESIIKQLEMDISSNKIMVESETVGGDVEKTIELEESEYSGYKFRESELIKLQEDRKKGVATLDAELHALEVKLSAHKEEHKGLAENVLKVLEELKLSSVQECKLFMLSEVELASLADSLNNYEQNLLIYKNKQAELEIKIAGRVSSPAILEQMLVQLDALDAEIRVGEKEQLKLKYEIEKLEEKLGVLSSLNKELEKLEKEYLLAKDLYDCLKGKALMEFIAEEFIDDISFMASKKLQVLMDGRYVLKYQNKEFFVVDNFNDASVRPVSTLSGGESFVVSLALALSISDAISTKANKNIDFFFLDEGFGTLDKDYCEYIVDSLVKLESQNLTIGLISHIPELQERISQKLQVVKTANGSRVACVNDI